LINLGGSISIPLLPPKIHKNSDPIRGNRRADCAVFYSRTTGAAADRYRRVCQHLARRFHKVARTRHGADKDLCTIRPRTIETDQRAHADVHVGVFKLPLKKFGVARLPRFALQQGDTRIAGILGMDTLYICHAIIDLDGMNLFLK
jgi:hypothetical protein